jgi:hypothetical protein
MVNLMRTHSSDQWIDRCWIAQIARMGSYAFRRSAAVDRAMNFDSGIIPQIFNQIPPRKAARSRDQNPHHAALFRSAALNDRGL